MEYDQESRWLRKNYRSAPCEGPSAKRVKLSTIRDGLESQFSQKYAHRTLSLIIEQTFPSTEKKRLSHDRATHVIGLEEARQEVSTPTSSVDKEQLRARIRELEQTVKDLQQRVHQLEEQVQVTSTTLCTQADKLADRKYAVFHGPNTISHFEEFSLDKIRSEMKENAPLLFQLFNGLSRSDGNEDSPDSPQGTSDNQGDGDLKALTSVSVMLKSRSPRLLGLQLLIGMMLVGRATSRRVRQYIVPQFQKYKDTYV